LIWFPNRLCTGLTGGEARKGGTTLAKLNPADRCSAHQNPDREQFGNDLFSRRKKLTIASDGCDIGLGILMAKTFCVKEEKF